MNWYQCLAIFFAGAILANAVPHFVHGISGNRFPTPFARPHGIGLSSAPVNMVWSLFNLAIGAALLHAGRVTSGNLEAQVIFFAGIAALSIPSSVRFQRKQAS